jgi:hypothetical protein
MSGYDHISISYLQDRLNSADLLNYRRNFTRQLGKEQDYEESYLRADSDANRQIKAFRGINSLNPSPFKTRPLKDFRGIMKTENSGFVNPQKYEDKGVINRRQPEPGQLEFPENDPRQAERIDYQRVQDWIYVKQHPQLGNMLAEEGKLREEYFNQSGDSDYQIDSRIKDLARQRLESQSALDDDYLLNHPEEARLIALNAGDIAEAINEDPELPNALVTDPGKGYSDDIRRELARKVASQFSSDTGLDEAFFTEHPEAGLYFQQHPGLINRFNQNPETAKNYSRFYHQYQNLPQGEAFQQAMSELSAPEELADRYLSQNSQLATDIALSAELKTGDSLSDNINRFNLIPDAKVSSNEVYEEHLSALADEATGEQTGLDREFYTQHPNLALAVTRSPQLSQGLKSEGDEIGRFFARLDNSAVPWSYIRGAISSFISGYPLRNSTLIEYWS